jgi:hypothetical protein
VKQCSAAAIPQRQASRLPTPTPLAATSIFMEQLWDIGIGKYEMFCVKPALDALFLTIHFD